MLYIIVLHSINSLMINIFIAYDVAFLNIPLHLI